MRCHIRLNRNYGNLGIEALERYIRKGPTDLGMIPGTLTVKGSDLYFDVNKTRLTNSEIVYLSSMGTEMNTRPRDKK
ncbi:MAG: hypothetical protein JW716_05055 [Candidatus Aenigmarchaeota archaeon]|nr:hypothetical protein [Candidatus Aenigmarchaeota archaeon]